MALKPLADAGDPAGRLLLAPGTLSGVRGLLACHYRGRAPARVDRVLTAVDPRQGRAVVAALVVAHPVLNGPWREAAWPGLLGPGGPGGSAGSGGSGDRRVRARVLNGRVRCLARVVVDPRWRGLGVGSALVRAYLAHPGTTHTEALAAMGGAAPIFERAGMRAVEVALPARQLRLGRDLRALRIDPLHLLCPLEGPRLLGDERVRVALRRWAMASRGTRGRPRRLGGASAPAPLATDARDWADLAARAVWSWALEDRGTRRMRRRVWVHP